MTLRRIVYDFFNLSYPVRSWVFGQFHTLLEENYKDLTEAEKLRKVLENAQWNGRLDEFAKTVKEAADK